MAGHKRGQVPRMRKTAWTTDQWSSSNPRRRQSPPRPREDDERVYWRSPPPYKGPCQRVKVTARDYCNFTTLHGLRYTTTTNTKHWFERFIWVVVCALALAITVILCLRTWGRFQDSPTLTTVENTNHPIWDIPFPAVTMCNVNQVYRKAAMAIQAELARVGEVNETDAHMFLRDLPNLIRPGRVRLSRDKMESIQISLEENGLNTDDLMKHVAQPCSTQAVVCFWKDKPVHCGDIISPSKTQDGNCCSFSYPINSSAQQYPTGAGEGSGLKVYIQAETDEYFAATRPFYATKVVIHDPMEYPHSENGALVQPGESVTLAVSVATIESDASVRDLKPTQRGCLFPDERGPFFNEKEHLYNYRKCIQKCNLQAIIGLCDCAPFYYPDRPDGVRICNLMDVQCMIRYRDKTALDSIARGSDAARGQRFGQCGCLPECSETIYNVDIIQAKTRRGAFYTAQLSDINVTNTKLDAESMFKLAVLKVHFEDITCLKYRREAVMTWDSLFATFGGIVGLCLGGSVLSIVEIIYYATLRLWVSGIEDEKPPPTAIQSENQRRIDLKHNREDTSRDARKVKLNQTKPELPKYDYYPRRVVY